MVRELVQSPNNLMLPLPASAVAKSNAFFPKQRREHVERKSQCHFQGSLFLYEHSFYLSV